MKIFITTHFSLGTDPPGGRSAQAGDIGAQGHRLPRVLGRVRQLLRAHLLGLLLVGFWRRLLRAALLENLSGNVGLARRCLEVFWDRQVELPLVDVLLGGEVGHGVQVHHVGDQLRLGRRGELALSLALDAVEGLKKWRIGIGEIIELPLSLTFFPRCIDMICVRMLNPFGVE